MVWQRNSYYPHFCSLIIFLGGGFELSYIVVEIIDCRASTSHTVPKTADLIFSMNGISFPPNIRDFCVLFYRRISSSDVLTAFLNSVEA